MLILGLTVNVVFLGILKYTKFFQSIILSITGLHIPLPEFQLPLGVSFFTIQQIIYLVDCYEEIAPFHDLLDHASFVAFFPYVAMGPIVRARQLIPQLRAGGSINSELFARGSFLFSIGLLKKVFLAKNLAGLADYGFSLPSGLSIIEAWIACLAYTFQIYFDFSGYTDMALGVGLMLGFQLPPNFHSPLKSISIIDFWQRWHITLSQFITTYLYTPILRLFKKATLQSASIATLVAMAIAGLWHGPSWNFILFGVVHGVALVVNQYWRKKVRIKISTAISWGLTLGVVTFAFVFFRTASIPAAGLMLKALTVNYKIIEFTIFKSNPLGSAFALLLFLGSILAATLGPNSNELAKTMRPTIGSGFIVAGVLLLSVLCMVASTAKEFIYFAF